MQLNPNLAGKLLADVRVAPVDLGQCEPAHPQFSVETAT
jgi:hypothetical protein